MSFDTYEINLSIVILLFRCGLKFSLLTFTILIMSGIQEITKLVSETEGIMSGSDKYHGFIESAMDEVADNVKLNPPTVWGRSTIIRRSPVIER